MTLFKSFCDIAVVAAGNDVIAPTEVIAIGASGEYSDEGERLAIIGTPAVAVVAA